MDIIHKLMNKSIWDKLTGNGLIFWSMFFIIPLISTGILSAILSSSEKDIAFEELLAIWITVTFIMGIIIYTTDDKITLKGLKAWSLGSIIPFIILCGLYFMTITVPLIFIFAIIFSLICMEILFHIDTTQPNLTESIFAYTVDKKFKLLLISVGYVTSLLSFICGLIYLIKKAIPNLTIVLQIISFLLIISIGIGIKWGLFYWFIQWNAKKYYKARAKLIEEQKRIDKADIKKQKAIVKKLIKQEKGKK